MAEILVVVGIIGMLIALVVPAVQAARESARRTGCVNNLRQIGLALQHHQTARLFFPPGVSSNVQYPQSPWLSWCARLLPYLEQNPTWEASQREYQRQANPFQPAPHGVLSTVLSIYGCPSDDRVRRAQMTQKGYTVGLTSYLGITGTDYQSQDGVLFRDSRINPSDIRDGVSNTVIVGERPPSPDYWFGWWYAGVGQLGSGVPDMLLGAREQNIGYGQLSACSQGRYKFGPGNESDMCHTLHFWSMHPGGAHFAFADASVRFLRYEASDLLAALATRAGREPAP